MFIKKLQDCDEFIAGDNSLLRELLHPVKANLAIRYSLAHAIIKSGQTSKPHRLKTSEVYYILEGEATMHIDGESEKILPGHAIYIPPYSEQYIQNTGRIDIYSLWYIGYIKLCPIPIHH